jgi:hypothetical protein
MKGTKFISIPKPCHENWDVMTPKDQGRFCLSCEKTVTDFTRMPDYEIINFFKNNKSTCGRFTNTQLERPYDFNTAKPKPPLFKALIFSIINFLGIQSYGQYIKTDSGDSIPIVWQDNPVKGKVIQVPVSVGDSILADSIKEDIPGIDSIIADKPNINAVTLDSIQYEPIEFVGTIKVSGNIVVTTTLGFCAPVDYKPNIEYPKLNMDIHIPVDSGEIKKTETIEKEPKQENNTTAPITKILFQWMSSVPVYRLLKKNLRIK